MVYKYDFLIIGAGVAGMSYANLDIFIGDK